MIFETKENGERRKTERQIGLVVMHVERTNTLMTIRFSTLKPTYRTKSELSRWLRASKKVESHINFRTKLFRFSASRDLCVILAVQVLHVLVPGTGTWRREGRSTYISEYIFILGGDYRSHTILSCTFWGRFFMFGSKSGSYAIL